MWLVGLWACTSPEQSLVGADPPPRARAQDLDVEAPPEAPGEEAADRPDPLHRPVSASSLPAGDDDADDPDWVDPNAADFLYDGTVRDFEIHLDDDAMSALRSDPYTDVPARFEFGDEAWDVGFRLKGSSTFRTFDGKPSFKVDFHEWDASQRFYGKKRITLNNMVSDPTMLREHAYYWMCERIGLPAPRHGFARVWVDGDLYGLYGVVETMDEQFIDRVFAYDDDGGLWEGSGADVTPERDWFDVDEVGLGDLDALVAAVDSAERDRWLEMLEAHFDTDALFAYLAMDIVSGNPDGYTYNHHNYHLYYQPLENRWTLIPWGTDRSFSKEEVPVRGNSAMPILGALVLGCLADEDCERRLDAAILDMADAWEAHDLAGFVDQSEAKIREAAESDPRAEYGWSARNLAEFVEHAPDSVRRQLE
jgi:hypothetical protein